MENAYKVNINHLGRLPGGLTGPLFGVNIPKDYYKILKGLGYKVEIIEELNKGKSEVPVEKELTKTSIVEEPKKEEPIIENESEEKTEEVQNEESLEEIKEEPIIENESEEKTEEVQNEEESIVEDTTNSSSKKKKKKN